jgi:hypothetical protein
MPIKYARAQKLYPIQKAGLTRAINQWKKTGDPKPVVVACENAIRQWNIIGAWPDGWHRWNIALQDATGWSLDEMEEAFAKEGRPL